MNLGLSGLASGFDWRTLVDQLSDVERAPQRALLTDQSGLQQRNNAYGSLKTELAVLQSRVAALKDAALYDSRTAQVGDATIASASVSAGAAAGAYALGVSQLATASQLAGTANIGAPLSATSDVSGLTLANARFPTAVTAGTFTVNGQQVTIATTDTLQGVFDKIASATGNAVTASYSPGTDKITLASGSAIVLGTATDTSNFLQVARLNNTGTGTVTSGAALGGVSLSATLSAANLTTAVSDGGSGAGQFKINGVAISFNAGTDTVATVISRINNSAAGVTASYDAVNDRFSLTSKVTGDLGLALQDVTGNFLAAAGLSAGTLTRGKNLLYTVNGGNALISQSNTITESSSGITGLSVTALKEGTTTVTVDTDSAKIKSAITGFIEAYNRVQSLIDTQTTSSTDAKGKVTAGTLAIDGDASELASRLRGSAYSPVTGLTGTLDHLADLGIVSSGNDDKLTLEDASLLDTALSGNLNGVQQLFADATNGLAVKLDAYLERTIGDDGSLVAKQDGLTRQASDIDTQITDLERVVQMNRQRMIDGFVAMETAQAKTNQQLQFLLRQFGQS